MSFIEDLCINLFKKEYKSKFDVLNYIISTFYNNINCEIIYVRPKSKIPFIFSHPTEFNTDEYNFDKLTNIILDHTIQYDKSTSCLQKINKNTNHKYIISDKIIVTDYVKTFVNYIHIYFSDKNLKQYFDILINFIKQEESNFFFKSRLFKLQKFEKRIIKSFNRDIPESKIERYIKYLLKIIVEEYGMTCGCIVENLNGSYYPTAAHSVPNSDCIYSLYDYKGITEPWESIFDFLDNMQYKYLYEVDKSLKKYFKFQSFPKSVFIMKYKKKRKDNDILFFLTNNDECVNLDNLAVERLLSLFKNIGTLVYMKNKTKTVNEIKNNLKNKLIKWKNKDSSLQKTTIRTNEIIKNILKNAD